MCQKKKKRKYVVVFSTMHHDDKIDENIGDMTKKEIITLFNVNKDEVAVVNELKTLIDVSYSQYFLESSTLD